MVVPAMKVRDFNFTETTKFLTRIRRKIARALRRVLPSSYLPEPLF